MRAPLAARRLALFVAAWSVLTEGALRAQAPTAANVDFFGPDPRPVGDTGENPVIGFFIDVLGRRSRGEAPRPFMAGMDHLLTFQDGRQLRGELVSLRQDEILWKRGDASEILRFSRAEIRSITLNAPVPTGSPQVRMQPADGTLAIPSRATVKLPGGDWLYADVQSKDGETFDLSLGETKFSVPRTAVQWMHFGMSPAPAATLTTGPLALDGWVRGAANARIEEKDGWMQVKDGTYIGRNLTPPKRFEIAFDLDPADQKPTGLWIQPFGPQPNCYGTGTINLEFKPGEIQRCIYITNIKHEKSAMPKDAAPDGRAHLRVLYDGLNDKIYVYRNGQQVGDWKLKDDAQQAPNQWAREINGICVNRDDGPKLGQFRILPWNGTLPPAEGEGALTQDSLTVGKDAPILGKVGEINPTDLHFSGAKKPRGGGVFVQFPPASAPTKPSEVALIFGANGEVAASGLEVNEGKATFQTNFSGPLSVQASTLQIIAFPPAATVPTPTGALVFRNGDELPGTLLQATQGAPLRWKTPSGQELQFQSERVAGVRMPPLPNPVSPAGAVLEMRNGDRLRGEVVSFDDKKIQFQHPALGRLSIDRSLAWSILPGKTTITLDAGNDPGPWVKEGVKATPGDATSRRKVYLDGRFLLRGSANGNNTDRDTLTRTLEGLPDQLEVRCEVLDMSGNEPSLSMQLQSKAQSSGHAMLDIDFSYGSLRFYGWVSGPKQQNFWRDVPLRNRNGGYIPATRISVRIFVNNKTGTTDIYVDGEHKLKSGPANERMPGVAHSLTISGSSGSELPVVISDVWVGPWNGELPKEAPGGCVIMANGDQADAPPKTLREGQMLVETAGGEMEIPMPRVSAIQFPGQPEPKASPGRLRLASGDAISVDSFVFDGRELVARHPALGELRFPAAALRELVFAATPARFPKLPAPKKRLASETPANPILPVAP